MLHLLPLKAVPSASQGSRAVRSSELADWQISWDWPRAGTLQNSLIFLCWAWSSLSVALIPAVILGQMHNISLQNKCSYRTLIHHSQMEEKKTTNKQSTYQQCLGHTMILALLQHGKLGSGTSWDGNLHYNSNLWNCCMLEMLIWLACQHKGREIIFTYTTCDIFAR